MSARLVILAGGLSSLAACVSATGIRSTPTLVVDDPVLIDFGEEILGESSEGVAVQLRSTGDAPLQLIFGVLPGEDFRRIDEGPDEIELPGGEQIELRFDFRPLRLGPLESRLVVQHDDRFHPDSPLLIDLVGVGLRAAPVDADGDGSPSDEDCDDSDPALNFDDLDGDGFSTCEGDCDDTDPNVFAGAAEFCDNEDSDCDGEIDEDAADRQVFWPDEDGDGFGDDDAEGLKTCFAPEGWVAEQGDCDESDPEVNVDATEVCDGVDNDCDTLLDEGCP